MGFIPLILIILAIVYVVKIRKKGQTTSQGQLGQKKPLGSITKFILIFTGLIFAAAIVAAISSIITEAMYPEKYKGAWNLQLLDTKDANKKGELEISGLYKEMEDTPIYAEVVYTKWNHESATEEETEPKYVKIMDVKKKYGEFHYKKTLGKNISKATYKIYAGDPRTLENDSTNLVEVVHNKRYEQKELVMAREAREKEVAAIKAAEEAKEEAQRKAAKEALETNRFEKVVDTDRKVVYDIYMEAYTDLYITGNASNGADGIFVLRNMSDDRQLDFKRIETPGSYSMLLKGTATAGYKRLIINFPQGFDWTLSVE